MQRRLGSVIVFKEGVTAEEAEAILLSLKDKVEIPIDWETNEPSASRMLHSFNPNYGGPVWYVP